VIIAFDLDGTLCNIEHRLQFIHSKPSNWPAFFRACVDDKPISQMIRVAEAMWNAGHTIEIWSGRSDVVREQTEGCLKAWGVKYHTLRMRKDGDYRADNIVKGEWYDGLRDHERPVLAFDDRQQVVDMWRSKDVLCAQVAPGDF
jgi:hypothetical protein